jgi:GNAT superfamily N-acetyltransferase
LDILNEAFAELHGVVPLTRRQIVYYAKKFLYFMDKDFLVAVVDEENRLQGFALGIPSLSEAFRRARGRLLPWGWWHIWRGLRSSEVLDFLLVGVRKRYQGQGLNALMMARLYEKSMAARFVLAESNPILETNTLSLALYEPFRPIYHKRRRVFRKEVAPGGPRPFAGQEARGHGAL